MRCFTLENRVVTPGIVLWQDNPQQCFVHIQPDLWLPVRVDLLSLEDGSIERRDGQTILHRASAHVIGNHVVEFIPENPGTENTVCVKGHIDKAIAAYDSSLCEPTGAISHFGLDFHTAGVYGTRRITERTSAGQATKLDNEEYSFVAPMNEGDRIFAKLMFYRDAQPVGPWVEGAFVVVQDGVPQFRSLPVCALKDRFARRR